MLLPLPIKPTDAMVAILQPALALLPDSMNTPKACVMLLSISQQESGLATRRQYGNGPARGLWQFEQGTKTSRGGVWGLYLFDATKKYLQDVCASLNVPYDAVSIYNNLETNDLLACCVARLMLYTDAKPLPEIDDVTGSWAYYERVWKPGKPRQETWAANHQRAVEAV